MHQRTILILEDDGDRVRGFQRAMASLGGEYRVRIWGEASTMIAEAPACFLAACLVSLDHDLEARAADMDPGTGLDAAKFLSLHEPLCPVILHASNFDGRMAMYNRLRAGGWTVATVPPREADWIETSWLPMARRLIGV